MSLGPRYTAAIVPDLPAVPVRVRGLAIVVASVLASVVAFRLEFRFGVTTVPIFVLAAPQVLILVGLIELITGLSIRQADRRWQQLPRRTQVIAAVAGGLAFDGVVFAILLWFALG